MRSNKGITLAVLVITIVILLIIASISIGTGNKVIKSSELENMITNMLLIKAKGKEYVENANFKLGPKFDTAEDKQTRIDNAKTELKGTIATSDEVAQIKNKIGENKVDTDYTFYSELTMSNLEEMGIKGVQLEDNETYIIRYEIDSMEVEVYNTLGYNGKYSLTDIDKIEE